MRHCWLHVEIRKTTVSADIIPTNIDKFLQTLSEQQKIAL
jgi:hypothetical protein